MAELVKEPEKITRFTFLRNGMRAFVGLTLGVVGGWTAFGARKKNTVWQIVFMGIRKYQLLLEMVMSGGVNSILKKVGRWG